MKTISKIKTQRSQIRHFESTPSVSSCNNTLSLLTTTSFVPKRVRQEIWRSPVCSDATPMVFYHTRNNGQVIHGFMQLGVTLHWVVGHCHFFNIIVPRKSEIIFQDFGLSCSVQFTAPHWSTRCHRGARGLGHTLGGKPEGQSQWPAEESNANSVFEKHILTSPTVGVKYEQSIS